MKEAQLISKKFTDAFRALFISSSKRMENINLRKRIQEINTLLNPTFTNTLSADGSTIIIEEWNPSHVPN